MIADDVRRALSSGGPALDRNLAETVAPVGWRRLAAMGIDPPAYSTWRALSGDPAPRRGVIALLNLDGRDDPIQVETFADGMPPRYAELGMEEPRLEPTRMQAALEAGLAELAASPDALAAVRALVWTIHPLRTADPAYDVSYSDPEVPFSIFVGVHEMPVEQEGLRIAEAILHETMHLQLSLAEDVVPLVAGAEERWSSPWQRRPRPAQGILHGLYVFRAVAGFLHDRLGADPNGAAADYIRRRLSDIATETAEVAGLAGSEELTDVGRELVRHLVSPDER